MLAATDERSGTSPKVGFDSRDSQPISVSGPVNVALVVDSGLR
jgi:hypothetical protein